MRENYIFYIFLSFVYQSVGAVVITLEQPSCFSGVATAKAQSPLNIYLSLSLSVYILYLLEETLTVFKALAVTYGLHFVSSSEN